MYNILVVDDEKTIRKGLIGFINWSYLDCNIVADVENGIAAKEILKSNHIDIVISDIKMPGIDGLELSKYIYENHHNVKIILYTGYSDFEYAKKAIKYGASDFILKPSTTKQITEVIKHVTKAIDVERAKDTRIKNLEFRLKDIDEKEKTDFIKDIINAYITNVEDIEKGIVSHKLDIGPYVVLLYKISNENQNDNLKKIMTFITLSLNDMQQYTFIYKHGVICSLIEAKGVSDDGRIKLIVERSKKIESFVKDFTESSITIGISNIRRKIMCCRKSVHEAEICLDRIFYGEQSIIVFSQINEIREIPNKSIDLDKIFEYIKNKKNSQAANEIEILFQNFESTKEPIDYIRATSISIYSKCLHVMKCHNLNLEDIFNGKNIYSNLLNSKSISNLKITTMEMVDSVINFTMCDSSNYIINNALAYIEENYERPIKLNDIANSIHVNSSYLSRVFKQKTGTTITQTLRKKRIEKAKDIIKTTKTKLYTIASMVGFDDPSYFSFVFKQETGMSPAEYKKTLQSSKIE